MTRLLCTEVLRLELLKLPPRRIVEELDTTPAALERALQRAGRHDLARPFGQLKERDLRGPCLDCGKPRDRKATRCATCNRRHRWGR